MANVPAADPVAWQGPVPDRFATTICRSWMLPGPVVTRDAEPREVASLVERSATWSDHDRAQECVRICHKHPLLWQEFLFAEKAEKKRLERNAKIHRAALASGTSRDEFQHTAKKAKQQQGDAVAREVSHNTDVV